MSPASAFAAAIVDALRPDKRVTISQWAADERVLPPDTPEPGKWRNERTPYLIDIQNTMSPGTGIREGWNKKGHQLGGSASGENFIGHAVCTAAGSMLVVFPTLEDAKQWELTRFEQMRSSSRELRRRIRPSNEKGADNTKLRKRYPGGVMRLVGANRVGALKSATIRYVKFEEPDEYPTEIGDQGDTITLAKKRTSNFGRKARILGDGTPTIKGRSVIDANYLRGDQRRWHLCCPDCGHGQPLEWKQMKWLDADASTAQYACIECGALNAEHVWKGKNYGRRPDMTEAECKAAGLAYWEATAVGEAGVASWHMPSLIAPIGWRPWVECVAEWLAAQGDEALLKAFFNTVLGECYEIKIGAEVSAQKLQQRSERYDLMSCPAGGLVAVAGVDTQDNRLAVVIRAFGRSEESWGVWHGEIYGDTSSPEVWGKLRELLDAPIRHASGQVMRIDAAAIDSGGHRAEDVYAFCRDAQLRGKNWFATKGASSYDAVKLGKPRTVEFTWRGKTVPGGAVLRYVGTQAIKNLIDGRLKLSQPGGGYYHFPLGFQADYFEQIRAERREWRRDKGGNKSLWWVAGSGRNEAWDCEVYLYAAYLFAMSGRHAEVVFRMREKLFGATRQLELLDDGAPAVQTPAPEGAATEIVDEAATVEEEVRAPLPVQRRAVTRRPRRGFAQQW